MNRLLALLSSTALALVPSASLAGTPPQAINPPAQSSPVTPSNGGLPSPLPAILGRIVSLDDAAGIFHDGVTDDIAASQTVLNSVAVSGGGTVLVGAHQYALGSSVNAAVQPTAAQFNASGFTLNIANANSTFAVGNSIILSGFSSPLAQLNGTWRISTAGSGSIVVLTTLTGSQSSTASGLGTLYQNLTVPSNVKILCPKGLTGVVPAGTSYSQIPYTFLVSPAVSLVPNANSGIIGCNLVNSTVATLVQSTSTLRQNLTTLAAFAGTGINIFSAPDVELTDDLIVGFTTGISSYFGARARFSHLNIDATSCVNTDNSHDVSHYNDMHCWPFANAWAPGQRATGSISAIANNGSGLWRVSSSLAASALVGDTVYVLGAVGAGSANGRWTVAATDGSTYVDLTGTNAVGTSSFTGTTTLNSKCLKSMTGTAGIGIGDNISGTNIPAATTVKDVLPRQNVVCISAAMTATATGIAITTTPVAYSSGGTLAIDATARLGAGYSWTNGETNGCVDCFSFGHITSFYTGAGASWTSLIGPNGDGFGNGDPDYKTFWIDGSSVATKILGGSSQEAAIVVLGTSTNTNQAHIIQGTELNGIGRTLELATGRYEIGFTSSGNGVSAANSYVGDSIGFLGYQFNDLQTSWEFTTITGYNAVNLTGNTYAASSYGGQFSATGDVKLGGGTANCTGAFSPCSVSFVGPQLDATASSGTYTSYTIPGTKSSWLFTGAGTVASYTATLPVPSNGLIMDVAFQQAVTALTWATASGTGPAAGPASVVAGQTVHCKAWGTVWYCN